MISSLILLSILATVVSPLMYRPTTVSKIVRLIVLALNVGLAMYFIIREDIFMVAMFAMMTVLTMLIAARQFIS